METPGFFAPEKYASEYSFSGSRTVSCCIPDSLLYTAVKHSLQTRLHAGFDGTVSFDGLLDGILQFVLPGSSWF